MGESAEDSLSGESTYHTSTRTRVLTTRIFVKPGPVVQHLSVPVSRQVAKMGAFQKHPDQLAWFTVTVNKRSYFMLVRR